MLTWKMFIALLFSGLPLSMSLPELRGENKLVAVKFDIQGEMVEASVPTGTTVLECFQWMSQGRIDQKKSRLLIRRGTRMIVLEAHQALDATLGGRMIVMEHDEFSLVTPINLTPEEKRSLLIDLEGFLRRRSQRENRASEATP